MKCRFLSKNKMNVPMVCCRNFSLKILRGDDAADEKSVVQKPRTIIQNIIFLTAEAGSVITIVLSQSK